MFFYLAIIILTITFKVTANSKCSVDRPARTPKYHLIENCYRSKLGIVARVNITSLGSCQRFGIEKKGLAVNFSPPEAREDGVEYTCEVLKCAEADGGLSLVNDTKFDYYSIYAKPIPHVNSTCVPGIGMFFILTTKKNYTLGFRECKNITAVPSDIMSEQRTDTLALVLAGGGIETAFVGLRSLNGSAFVGSNGYAASILTDNVINQELYLGDTLDCINYRAWDPGHPRRDRKKFDCVLLTRYRTWRTTSCKKNYPMLCELVPGGPYKLGSIFPKKIQFNTTDLPVSGDE